jgi:membrane protein
LTSGRVGDARSALRRLARDTRRRTAGHDLALYGAGVTFYSCIAVVPVALLALRLAAVLAGAEQVRAYGDRVAEALPDAMGAPEAALALVEAGVTVSWLGVLIALLPASLYGEGLRRAFVALRDREDEDALVGWRGRLTLVPLLAVTPFLLLAVLSFTPLVARLFTGDSGWSTALGVVVAFYVDWVAISVALTYVYRVVAPGRTSWQAAAWGGFATGSFLSGFLQGFVWFLSFPIDLGAPFAGFVAVGGAVAVALWLWVLHIQVLVGYALTLELHRRGGSPFREPAD